MCFNPVETGERIRRLREHLGYSQTQLSEKIQPQLHMPATEE